MKGTEPVVQSKFLSTPTPDSLYKICIDVMKQTGCEGLSEGNTVTAFSFIDDS